MDLTLILLFIFYLIAPAVILYLCYRYPFLDKIGSVIIAYVFGLVLGNVGILPGLGEVLYEKIITHPHTNVKDVKNMLDAGLITANDLIGFQVYQLKDILMSITVLLAIPLMLFSTNLKSWKKLAGKVVLSLIIALFSVLSTITLGFFLFRNSSIDDLWKISGLLVGVYTGGTPNLASLKLMLKVDANTYILTHTYDLIIGVFYLGFLITVGKNLFGKFLPPFHNDIASIKNAEHVTNPKAPDTTKKRVQVIIKGLALSIGIAGVSLGIATLFPENLLMVTVILSITSLGIIASNADKINQLPLTFETGMYLILIFSLVVASLADISNFTGINPSLLGYISMAVFGSLLIHVLLCKLFKIDADTTMITSVSFICSPPFVPVIAGALGNKQIIISGITVGIIGYAIGNYLGYFLANFLKMF
ncbi:DUF819 family protein [Cecembia lonarensis]|uniref:Putative integral membrane protein n=1 Tax=Cecembia lonarensis (strain CCUG 58316 / KCTC 22772 / LW9) TaxID=1225176 RepID=K1L262_CECL9|nr:DUF819 family protein [Cecembia lonarensis]EKB50505.1 putative integral membrane protein [Cecembia lonarensis LW9]